MEMNDKQEQKHEWNMIKLDIQSQLITGEKKSTRVSHSSYFPDQVITTTQSRNKP